MHKLSKHRNCFSLIVLILFGMTANAQDVLTGDAAWPAAGNTSGQIAIDQPTNRVSHIATLAPFPFFDDFSYDSLRPSRTFWYTSDNDLRVPLVSTQKGLKVPSKGVISFDGTTAPGKKYDNDLGSGPTDSLRSNDIDLSGMSTADNLWLSFFVQPGGANDAPEATDSLVVLFDTTGNFDYTQVWSMTGTGAAIDSFIFANIPLDKSYYFHSAFRFKFIAYGSLNGEYDQWHVDYILLDKNRSANDNSFSDMSPSRILSSPMGDYTAMPIQHYITGGYAAASDVEVSSAGNSTMSGTISMTLADPTGSNTLGGTTSGSVSTGSISPYSSNTIVGVNFSDQSSTFGIYGAFRVKAVGSSGADAVAQNDTIWKDYPVDSVLALDDGVSDFGYGMTVPKSFCQEFTIPQADSITAVWINFTPAIYYNSVISQSYDLSGKSFRATIWDTLAVDSFIAQASGNVTYDSSLNEFKRYPFIRPVAVGTKFWVGIQQIDQMPINIGFDNTGTPAKIYYEDGSGQFVLSTNQGILMIRPEFYTPDGFAGRGDPGTLSFRKLIIYPNPSNSGDVTLELEGTKGLKEGWVNVYDLNGRLLKKENWSVGGATHQLKTNLQNGMYMISVEGKTLSGDWIRKVERLVITN